MTLKKNTPGRPRQYESSSGKVDAFRKRQESAGFLRKEILVTQQTWTQVMALAAVENVSALDVASGLLEHGLSAYQPGAYQDLATKNQSSSNSCLPVAQALSFSAQGAATPLRGSIAASAAPVSLLNDSVASGHVGNPITQFFSRRKGLTHATLQVTQLQPTDDSFAGADDAASAKSD